MSEVVLEDLHVHLASDLDTFVTGVATGIREHASRPVEVRRYANGRVRAITRPGVLQALSIDMELASRTFADQLRDWIGVEVMVRDSRGRVLWGVFDAIDVDELDGADDGYTNVRFVFQQITGTAEV